MVNSVKIIQKLAIVSNNKILVLLRSDNDDSRPGTWDLPGGNIDNEDVTETSEDVLLDALHRETKEEVGLDLKNEDVNAVFITSGVSDDGILVLWLGYECMVEKELDIEISFEHSQYRWVTKEEFINLDFGYATESMIEHVNEIELD